MQADAKPVKLLPLELCILFETEKERNDLFNILNHIKILDSVDSDFEPIRMALSHQMNVDVPADFEDFSQRLDRQFNK